MNYFVFTLAWASFFLAILSYIFGCVAMRNGKAQPSIISRFFWLILSITNFLSYFSLGAGSGIFLALSGVIGSAAVFLFSLKYGYIEFKRTDIFTILGACTALICYLCIPDKLITLFAGLLTHFISGIPTYKKTWSHPYTESLPFWLIFAIASVCSFVAVILENKNVIYPLYILTFDTGMTLLIILKRKKLNLNDNEAAQSVIYSKTASSAGA